LSLDDDACANRHGIERTGHLDHKAAHPDHAAIDIDTVEFVDLLGQRFHGVAAAAQDALVTSATPILTLYLPGPLIIASSLGIRRLARPSRRGEFQESVSAET
jgi:hypothetical protein